MTLIQPKALKVVWGNFIFVNYQANPITSAMFITATAPNPLVVDLVAKATNSEISLSWSTWAIAMLLLV
jgi:DASS family divalent anion:Na+ symporter